FRWHEIDLSYYALKALSWVGLVWDLHTPPKHVVRSEQKLRRVVIERAAGQLASSFQVEKIAADLHAAMAEKRASLDASVRELHDDFAGLVDKLHHRLDEKAETLREDFEQLIRSIDLPAMPSMADIRNRASDMFVRTPSMNDIVERARQMLIDDLCEQLLEPRAVLVRS
ncbi:MAG: acyl-CoA desaturase, partial [Alphaproteobacteria bacterium]|nr:acyl-CoA desaturase [Alphaproteobacteria bacterium]